MQAKDLPGILALPCAAIGDEGFLHRLDVALGKLMPHDMRWTIIYSAQAAPLVLNHACPAGRTGIDHDLIRRTYDAGYYRFDPFYRHWREMGEGGVFRLSDIAGATVEDTTYMMGFVPMTGFEDDIAMVFPVGNERALALTIERRVRFSKDEVQVLKSLYPLVAAMVESHWRTSGPLKETSERDTTPRPPLNFADAVEAFLPGVLTSKEREITKLSLAGFDNQSIAKALGVSAGTIKNHKKRLYAKVDVTSERELFSLFLGYLAKVDPTELYLQ